MRIIRLFLFILVIFVLQTVVLTHIRLFGAYFCPLLALVIIWGLMKGTVEGFFAGLLSGFLMDISAANILFFTVTYPLAGYLCGLARESVFRDEDTVIFAVVFLGSLITFLAEALLLSQFFGRNNPGFWTTAVISALLNTAFVPLMKMSLAKIGKNE
ncbi:MAG: hypothetical protein NTZ10_00595 [Candidatus Saganbacteria bacterium]|nr:hypothetical protein [Candidatus Saganbacteria bacterium]